MERWITFSEVTLATALSVGVGLMLEGLLFLLIFWAMKQVNLADDAQCAARARGYRELQSACRGEFPRTNRG